MTLKNKFLLFIWGIAFFLTTGCTTVYNIADTQNSNYRFSDKIEDTDSSVDSIIQPYKIKLDEQMNKVIGKASETMIKGKPESTLGNWLADALMEQSAKINIKADFAAQNYGGIRVPELAAGPIRIGQVFELMPFENSIVVLDVDGAELMVFLNRLAEYGGWPVSQQLKMGIKEERAVDVSLNGESIIMDKIYKIILPDYVANGGDNCDFFKDNKRLNTGVLLRDVLIDAIQEKHALGEVISGKLDGRMEVLD